MYAIYLKSAGKRNKRGGFTLVELLVVITIIVILLTMTLLTVNFSNEGDRVKGAAGQVQSFLAGARDRAIYAKEPRGVRFFVNPENPRAVNTMAYIAPGGSWSSPENSANVSLERIDGNGDGDFADPVDQVVRVHGFQNPAFEFPRGPQGTGIQLIRD